MSCWQRSVEDQWEGRSPSRLATPGGVSNNAWRCELRVLHRRPRGSIKQCCMCVKMKRAIHVNWSSYQLVQLPVVAQLLYHAFQRSPNRFIRKRSLNRFITERSPNRFINEHFPFMVFAWLSHGCSHCVFQQFVVRGAHPDKCVLPFER